MSITVKVVDQSGKALRDLALNEDVFGIEPNTQAMFDAVVMQQASLRQGTADTNNISYYRNTDREFRECIYSSV